MPRRSPFRRFNVLVGALVGVPLALTVIINVSVDATGVWGTPAWRGFNAYKVHAGNYERMTKAQAVMRLRPEIIFMGTSRARLGLDPDDYLRITGRHAYNLAMGDCNPMEFEAYFHHALYLQPALREVLIATEYQQFVPREETQLKFFGFDAGRLKRDSLPARDFANHTFTKVALMNSWRTILANLETPDLRSFGPSGQNLWAPWRRHLDIWGAAWSFNNYIWYFNTKKAAEFVYDPRGMESLRTIARECHGRGIRLTIMTTPAHALENALIHARGRNGDLEQWERDLAAIAGFWEFGGFNSVTTTPIGPTMPYADPVHFSPTVGRRMLATVSGKQDGGHPFGVWVDARNIDAHLARMRCQRAAWLSANRVLAQRIRAWPPMSPP